VSDETRYETALDAMRASMRASESPAGGLNGYRSAIKETLVDFFSDPSGQCVFIDRDGDLKNCTIDGQYDLNELVEKLLGYCG